MSKKIKLTEAQFRDYMRIQLKENTKKVINEEINYKVEKAKNGTPIAYIDPKTSENVYDFKDIIKKYGGKYVNSSIAGLTCVCKIFSLSSGF